MNYIQTEIDGVWLIEPNVYSDERGYFMEAFKKGLPLERAAAELICTGGGKD